MTTEDSYLGRGWSFPPSFIPPTYSDTADQDNPASQAARKTRTRQDPGGAVMVAGLTDIEQSLYILFSTRLGERVLAHDYGSALDTAVFEILNAATIARIQFLVHEAALFHEPRIEVLDVEVAPDADRPELVLVVLNYRVRSTNARHNYVYPFYLQEGSELNITTPR